ncbi:MAG: hypothetical protein ACI92Z_001463 [Paracoccaceae bacterium]
MATTPVPTPSAARLLDATTKFAQQMRQRHGGNGMVERFNGRIEDVLQATTSDQAMNWTPPCAAVCVYNQQLPQ